MLSLRALRAQCAELAHVVWQDPPVELYALAASVPDEPLWACTLAFACAGAAQLAAVDAVCLMSCNKVIPCRNSGSLVGAHSDAAVIGTASLQEQVFALHGCKKFAKWQEVDLWGTVFYRYVCLYLVAKTPFP
jgi:hypothetical protein